jgi:hypothetical protein
MKKKHVDIRIEQCITLSNASNCPRRKFGAMLIDPKRNVVLADGYNGGPRGGEGSLCRGSWCERDGLKPEDIKAEVKSTAQDIGRRRVVLDRVSLSIKGKEIWSRTVSSPETVVEANEAAKSERDRMLSVHTPIESGTRMEKGCHHAEGNVICNAAENGISTRGAWLIVTGEPCSMCAKSIHHAGIKRILCVKGGYKSGGEGTEYLLRNGVEVEYVDGPKDPRS